jgi:rare lipoprotein A (peptidoglycan hydrolase)
MINNTSSASALWAVPALVGMLSFPLAAHASEGGDLVAMAVQTTRLAAPVSAPAPLMAPAMREPAAAPAPLARPVPPAPRPLAAGLVWTDSAGEWRQVGVASWYGGRRWQGRLTASGVRYDERQLTAAHASLPIGSQVRVTVADTGRAVVVTIIDRPGTRKRIIDLSRAAAAELGILSRGVAQVTITPA